MNLAYIRSSLNKTSCWKVELEAVPPFSNKLLLQWLVPASIILIYHLIPLLAKIIQMTDLEFPIIHLERKGKNKKGKENTHDQIPSSESSLFTHIIKAKKTRKT